MGIPRACIIGLRAGHAKFDDEIVETTSYINNSEKDDDNPARRRGLVEDAEDFEAVSARVSCWVCSSVREQRRRQLHRIFDKFMR